MGWGKILGLAALGVGAVAAAPFTGGGSLLGAASIGASLAGAGTVAGAVGAGVAGATAGAILSESEEEEREKLEKKVAQANLKAQKSENIVKEHEAHTKLILALSALGISMANADGHISEEEEIELNEFIGGLSSQNYPTHIVEQINDFVKNPPNFNTALKYLEQVPSVEYQDIRNLLVIVMEADNHKDIMEKAYLSAFDEKVEQLTN